jgi:CHAD domain-containing protein
MPSADELVLSFDKSWKNFSVAWKAARTKASEEPIHDLRVSARRLVATLEIIRVLRKDPEIPRVQRRFRKVLKRMGPLRDVQVQLAEASKLAEREVVRDFKRTLEKRQRDEIDEVRRVLRRGTKRRLKEAVGDVRSKLTRLIEELSEIRIHQSLTRSIDIRKAAFLKARRRFQPDDDETLHKMRIALKKLRYTVEPAIPLLGASAMQQARRMQAFQQLLGDARDLTLLRAELERWAARRGKVIAIVPVLERVAEKRARLLNRVQKSVLSLEHDLDVAKVRPAMEKTHATTAATTGGSSQNATAKLSQPPGDGGHPEL